MRVCGLPAGTCWIDSAATPASPAAPSCWNLLSDTGLWPTAGTFLNGDLSLERLKDVSVEDLRLTRKLDACLLQPRPKLLAEGLDLLRRLPDLAHPDVVLRPEADVKLAALRGPVPGPRELVADGVVLLLGHVRGWEANDDAHGEAPLGGGWSADPTPPLPPWKAWRAWKVSVRAPQCLSTPFRSRLQAGRRWLSSGARR